MQQYKSSPFKDQPLVIPQQKISSNQCGIVSWLSEVNWPITLFLLASPFLATYGIMTTKFYYQTYFVCLLCCISGGLSITMGYHRLFSHRAYDAVGWFRIILVLLASQSFEGSVFEWCVDHRAHHRYTDTDLDPYNIKRGFWYAHMGWVLKKRDRSQLRINISDLEKDLFLVWQHKYYTPLALVLGLFLPMTICGLFWGDWRGGFFVAGLAARLIILHCTFCVNSVAHTIGSFSFNDQQSPRDHFLTSLITFGEGYHNFHHEFPNDYRNGVSWYDYDPSKWGIALAELLGVTFNLKRSPIELIEKGRLAMQQKRLDEQKSRFNWGTPVEQLPTITWDELNKVAAISANPNDSHFRNFVVVDGIVHDVSSFLEEHPGGRAVLQARLGKDITAAFNGGVYDHSLCARHVLAKFRVARILM